MLHFFGILELLGHAGGQRISVPQGLPPAVAVDVFNYGSCAYAAWPPSDVSTDLLVSYGTRHTCSSQTDPNRSIGAARDWIDREEQGLYGAGYLAQTLRNASVNVQGMCTNNIIGSLTGEADLRDPNSIRVFAQGLPLAEDETQRAQRLTAGGGNDSPARQLARFIAEPSIIYRLDRFPRGGDYRPFLEQGYSAVRFTEPNEILAHQHQDNPIENGQQFGDLPEFLDYEFGRRVAKVNMVALWSLAQAPGTVRNLTNKTSILGNNSTPTNAPLWARVVDVGNVNTATVALSKDRVIFGVRSVGRNGYKSPASFPCPTVA
ncbi:hypothetical protein IWZ03DRAFT_391318 [Phyllosticta citriasiana]|uniref:Uncharacterized protein n=1 Tax=Phyllosticta citriasiana TaxID=595635 RepID=A0ABR1L1A5_9PEZI